MDYVVLELFKNANASNDPHRKLDYLKQVSALVFAQGAGSGGALLQACWPAAVAFEADTSHLARAWLAAFIELSTHVHADYVSLGIRVLQRLSGDAHPTVQKAAIHAITVAFQIGLCQLATQVTANSPDLPRFEQLWRDLEACKIYLASLLHLNRGSVTLHVAKFIQTLIVSFSEPHFAAGTKNAESSTTNLTKANAQTNFSITLLRSSETAGNHPILNVPDIEHDAMELLAALLRALNSDAHVAATTLTAFFTLLTLIARLRTQFMASITENLVHFYSHMPELPSKTQRKSVNHAFKAAVNALLKYHVPGAWNDKLQQLLSGRIIKGGRRNLPGLGDVTSISKRMRTNNMTLLGSSMATLTPSPMGMVNAYGRPQFGTTQVDVRSIPSGYSVGTGGLLIPAQSPTGVALNTTTHLSSSRLPRSASNLTSLPVDIVVSLLIENLSALPAPAYLSGFQGSQQQHQQTQSMDVDHTDSAQPATSSNTSTAPASPEATGDPRVLSAISVDVPVVSTAPPTKLLPEVIAQSLIRMIRSINRRKKALTSGAGRIGPSPYIQDAILARLAPMLSLTDPAIPLLLEYASNSLIAAPPSSGNAIDGSTTSSNSGKNFLLSWLTAEYLKMKKLEKSENGKAETGTAMDTSTSNSATDDRYDTLLSQVLLIARHKLDPTNKLLISLILDLPAVTDAVYSLLRDYCEDQVRSKLGFATLRELILARPPCRDVALDIILSFVSHPVDTMRLHAIKTISGKLFSVDSLAPKIEIFATQQLQSLVTLFTDRDTASISPEEAKTAQEQSLITSSVDSTSQDGVESASNHQVDAMPVDSTPVEQDLTESDTSASVALSKMTIDPTVLDNEVQHRLLLFLALSSKKQELIDTLVDVYTRIQHVEVRKALQRIAIGFLRTLGQDSPAILRLIRACPEGAESFLLQLMLVLTETTHPTSTFVQAVMELYRAKHNDARYLIPVLPGLSKDEAIAVLPSIVALPSAPLKASISRILHAKPTPLTPSELLVYLHLVDIRKDNLNLLKVVEAIQACFEETKIVVRQDVLAVVLQQLVDVTPIPPVFMRTVLQTLGRCQPMISFVMGILSKVVAKQVWNDDRLWKGFVRCCASYTPQSVPVLLQLPPPQFDSVLQENPQLCGRIVAFVEKTGRGLPKALQEILVKHTPSSPTVNESALLPVVTDG